MNRARVITAIVIALCLRWLAGAQVSVGVARVPALPLAATALAAVAGLVVALLVWRVRAERAMLAAWHAPAGKHRKVAG